MGKFDVVAYKQALAAARADMRQAVDSVNFFPIAVRLAWHDSGSYDVSNSSWPECGGANGSIRFAEELDHGANAGLIKAKNFVQKIKDKHPVVSWADLIQMASAEAIALAGGPKINMRYGRVDADKPVKEGNLPDAMPPFKGEPDAATHLRNVFHRMGFTDKDIVTLSGAHTLGRAFKERSGTTENGYGAKKGTKHTSSVVRHDGRDGVGLMGGKSWTKNWLSFDNSYFTEKRPDNDLLWLPTDKALQTDPKFSPHFEKYAQDESAFRADYAEVHKQLSELGSKWVVPGGIRLEFDVAGYRAALSECEREMIAAIDEESWFPILIRLAWHDSGSFDVSNPVWPACGGANGSIRFKDELNHGANAGLAKAKLFIGRFKEKYPMLSWADLMQMASAISVRLAGGPKIQMRYGRLDADEPVKEGNLPDALPPFKGEPNAATHLRNVFYRMGFSDREIVALSGAHTLGRAFKERSGVTENGYGAKKATQYTSGEFVARPDGRDGVGFVGGRSWTKSWLTFDNSYYTQPRPEGDLLWLPTDDALRTDPGFAPYFELYRQSNDAFLIDYADAHKALSEIGSKWVIPGGITLPMSKL